jgi:hypothetical protein
MLDELWGLLGFGELDRPVPGVEESGGRSVGALHADAEREEYESGGSGEVSYRAAGDSVSKVCEQQWPRPETYPQPFRIGGSHPQSNSWQASYWRVGKYMHIDASSVPPDVMASMEVKDVLPPGFKPAGPFNVSGHVWQVAIEGWAEFTEPQPQLDSTDFREIEKPMHYNMGKIQPIDVIGIGDCPSVSATR